MKHKILIAILSLTMVFSTGFSFAEDQEIPTEENIVKQEVVVEETTPTEEVKQEEEKEVITEEPKEESKEETKTEEPKANNSSKKIATNKENVKASKNETKEKTPVTKVIVHFWMKGTNGGWTRAQGDWSAVASGSKALSYYNKPARNSSPLVVGDITYTFLESWKDELGNTYAADDSVRLKGTNIIALFDDTEGPTAELNVYAQYKEKSLPKLTANYIDNIGNGGRGESHIDDGKTVYTHTFNTPPDAPDQYKFLYWKNFDNEDVKNPGETFTVEANSLEEDTVVNYYAVYEYQPTIEVVYNYKENHKDVTYTTGAKEEAINIYDSAPINLYWFYENSDTPIDKAEVIDIPEKIIVTERADETPTTTNVYAHYFTITWVDDEENEVEKDEDVAYSEIPEYNGDEPTKTATSEYTYSFKEWTPEIVKVTENATYKAVFISTPIIIPAPAGGAEVPQEPKEEPKEDPQEPTNPPNSPNQEKPKQEESPAPVVPQTPEEPQTQPTVQEPEQPQVPAQEPEQPTQEPVQPTSSEKDDLTILDDSVLQKDPLVQPKQEESNVTNGLDQPRTTPAQRQNGNNNNNNNNYIPEIPANYLYNYVAEDAPTKQLTDTGTPLAIGAVKTGSWALINLLAMLANFILSFLLICLAILNKNKEDEEIKINNKNKWRIGSIILAIVFAIIFFLTEDINLPMVLVDKWTLLMIIGFIIQLIFTFASKHKEEEQDE